MLYKSLVTKISIPPEKKTKQKEYLEIGLLPIVDQGKEIIGGYTNEVEKNIVCNLPVIVFGDHTCSVKYINFPFGAGADGIKILKAKDNVLPQYLFYGTQYLVFHLHDRGYARHYQHIEKMDLYVPPIEEQRRIVSRIEELFSELDSAVETLQKTRQQLEIYRQAVLKEAFESIQADLIKLQDLCFFITKGTTPKKNEMFMNNGEIPYIKVYNLTFDNTLDFSIDPTFVSNKTHNEFLKRSIVYPGDVLMNIVGPPMGKVSIVPDTYPEWNINQAIARFRCSGKLYNRYLAYFLGFSGTVEKMKSKSKATAGQFNLTLEICREIEIPVPSYHKQIQLVSNIETKVSQADKILKVANEALQQAEAMRQSILKKAFEGEL